MSEIHVGNIFQYYETYLYKNLPVAQSLSLIIKVKQLCYKRDSATNFMPIESPWPGNMALPI
jgi:hypothetical protein